MPITERADQIIDGIKSVEEAKKNLAKDPRAIPRTNYPVFPTFWWDLVDCDDCDCERIKSAIMEQLETIHKLEQYKDFTKPFPDHENWADAAGGRSEAYEQAPQCIKVVVDEMESWIRTLSDAIDLGITVILEGGPSPKVNKLKRNIEISRSREFTALLIALFWLCCGEESYKNLLKEIEDKRQKLESD